MSLEKLIDISRRYGSDKSYVIAGGGNTSWKNDEYMYVKGSGTELASITADGFVKVNLSGLDAIWEKKYSDDADAREEEVLADLMAARYPSEGKKRPSVETLLHALLPFSFVVHTHPALVNGITCSREGESAVDELFWKSAIWVPVTNPGYILAKEVKEKIESHMKKGNDFPRIIFLQNHGVFVSGGDEGEIDRLYGEISAKIGKRIKRQPDGSVKSLEGNDSENARQAVKRVLGEETAILGFANRDILEFSESAEAFKPLSLSFTPDHIVYYGYRPLYCSSSDELERAIAEFVEKEGINPRLAVIKGLGAMSFNASESMAAKGKELFLDDVKIAVYTESFGGFQFMPADKINFIRNWEVEKYRLSVSK